MQVADRATQVTSVSHPHTDTRLSIYCSQEIHIPFGRVSQSCEKGLLVSSSLPASPTVRMEQLGSHWTDFYEIWYYGIF